MRDLTPITERLDWALRYIDALDSEVRKFLDTKPYDVIRERDANTGGYLWRVAVRNQPPRYLSFMAGDCIHNIRSPLDNLVHLLADGATDQERRNVAFVIKSTPDDFRGRAFKLAGLPQATRDIIARLQPFAPGQRPQVSSYVVGAAGTLARIADPNARTDDKGLAEKHPLAVLERLWNDDKHRAPGLIGMVSRRGTLHHGDLSIPIGTRVSTDMVLGVVHDGDKIASFAPGGFRIEADVKYEPEFQVTLDKEGEAFRNPLIPLLRRLHDHVRNVVVPQFAEV